MAHEAYKVVLDTSVVVAASRSKRGASSLLIQLLNEGRFNAVVSAKLIFEYEAVLRREVPPDGWSSETIDALLDFMCYAGDPVDPFVLLRPSLTDPGDEFVLELAFAAGAELLVTHNVRDFAGASAYGVRVIKPGDFVRLLRGES